jgi:phage baseplate assembly protein W
MIRSEVIAVIGKHEPRAIIQDVNVLNLRDSQEVQVDVLYVVASSGRQDTITTMIPTNGAI